MVYNNHMELNGITPASRPTAVNSLAAIGFVALVGGGMWLAVLAAAYVPNVVGPIGSAAATLSQIFIPAPKPSLSVIPTASTTIPFADATSLAATVPETVPAPAARTAGAETTATFPIGSSTPASLSGLPDLAVRIDSTGYMTGTTTDSFVATTSIPANVRPVVKFTITNTGTNATGPWRFSATIPTQTAYVYQSAPQQSLLPGDSIQYALGFDQPNRGVGQTISVIANFDKAVKESDYSNDAASVSVAIFGS